MRRRKTEGLLLQKIPTVLHRDLNSTGFNKTKFKVRCLKAHKAGCDFGKAVVGKELQRSS